MKKLLFVLLILMLCSSPLISSADDMSLFEPSIINTLDLSTSTIFATEDSRALFTTLLAIEYSGEVNNYNANSLLNCSSYIAINKAERIITIFLPTNDDTVHIVMYCYDLDTAVYLPTFNGDDSFAETSASNSCDQYYKNSKESIISAFNTLQSIFE